MTLCWVNLVLNSILLFKNVFGDINPSKVDWCQASLKCPNGQSNYACGGCPLKDKCRVMTDLMTTEFRSKMLKAHNTLRNKVALGKEARVPPEYKGATNMLAFSYDSRLEYLAECWLRKCEFAHTLCQNIPNSDGKLVEIGQNLFVTSGSCTEEAVLKGLNSWYEEEIAMDGMNLGIYKSFKKGDWGHYTQVIWAETSKVGCSVSKDGKRCLLACNYAIAGNWKDQIIYEQGESASKCSNIGVQINSEFKGLCGDIKEYDGTTWNIDNTLEIVSSASKITKTVEVKKSTDESPSSIYKGKKIVTKETESEKGPQAPSPKIKPDTEKNKPSLENIKSEEKKEGSSKDIKKNKERSDNKKDDKKELEKLDLPWLPDKNQDERPTTEPTVLEKLELPWIANSKPAEEEPKTQKKLELPWITKNETADDNDVINKLEKLDLPWIIQSIQPPDHEDKTELPELDLPWMKNLSPRPKPDNPKVIVDLPVLNDLPWIQNTSQSEQDENKNKTDNDSKIDSESENENRVKKIKPDSGENLEENFNTSPENNETNLKEDVHLPSGNKEEDNGYTSLSTKRIKMEEAQTENNYKIDASTSEITKTEENNISKDSAQESEKGTKATPQKENITGATDNSVSSIPEITKTDESESTKNTEATDSNSVSSTLN